VRQCLSVYTEYQAPWRRRNYHEQLVTNDNSALQKPSPGLDDVADVTAVGLQRVWSGSYGARLLRRGRRRPGWRSVCRRHAIAKHDDAEPPVHLFPLPVKIPLEAIQVSSDEEKRFVVAAGL
jgi:hypothetical protein